MGYLARTAVIVGAGMAGLPVARVLAEFFEQIVVLESDERSPLANRPGTPQSKHLHVLLAGGMQALEQLFPGLRESLSGSGAQMLGVAEDYRLERPGLGVFPQRNLGLRILSLSRSLLENEVRSRVLAIRNIEIREKCRATAFVLDNDGTSTRGARYQDGDGASQDLPADLVVDASGHGQLTLNLLAKCGLPMPFEDSVGIDMHYASTSFDGPARLADGWRVLVTYPDSPRNRRGGFLLPVENGKWMVTLIGRHDCQSPSDINSFLDYARQLPTRTLFDILQKSTLSGDVARHGLRASRWRHFEKIDGLPQRIIPFGDTICRFNPIYGQGMTVAAMESCLLQKLLRQVRDANELASIPSRFLQQCQSLIDVPWTTAVVPDFVDPLTEGKAPDNIAQSLAFQVGLLKIAREDAAVHKLMVEVQHLMRPKTDLLAPDLVQRIRAIGN